ncbi:MAG: iron-sulfur-binding protein [marine bacterium B5-7]|nr:MAG: iron-sulfur-binding protein [marine bacterium B5-7]
MPITIETIDALLPQTQCEECSYKGCRPYAEAILNENERLDRCPPGGVETLKALGDLLKKDVSLLIDEMAANTREPTVAVIQEDLCIGCTKCIKACPVDAIVGSGKLMHSIISSECTGCELCIPPCPMDCIDIIKLEKPSFDKDQARKRFNARTERLARLKTEEKTVNQEAAQKTQGSIKLDIAAAVARAKAKKDASA